MAGSSALCSATSATKAATDAIPTGIAGTGMATLEGRPQPLIDGTPTSVAVASNWMPFAITDATAQARRSIVDINKCNDCHKNLSLHGDNRSGNTEKEKIPSRPRRIIGHRLYFERPAKRSPTS